MQHLIRRISATTLASFLAVSLSAQQDWPMYQVNASHTGFMPMQIGFQTVSPRWTVSYASNQDSHITTGSGKLFFSSIDRKLIALEQSTGDEVWRQDFSSAAYVNPPSYADGKVYIQTVNHSNDTYLRCYDANTGQLVFQSAHSAQWEQYLAPTYYDGKVYVNGGSYGGMYAFDGTSGAQLWFNSTLAQYDRWTPAVAGDTAYAYVGGTLTAINRHTGAAQYTIVDPSFSWAGWSMRLAPILGGMDDVLVVHGGRLVRFDLLNRQVAYNTAGNFSGQPAVRDSVVYVISSGTLQARDQATGSLLWSFGIPNESFRDEVIVTLGHVFVRSSNNVYAVDLDTHQSVWSYPAGGHVALTQGALYMFTSGGQLVSLGFAPQPTPQLVDPGFQNYLTTPAPVTLHGSGFLVDPATLTVSVGGVAATNVVVIDDSRLECVVPLTAPGVYDVVVQNQFGLGALEAGFAVTPAVDIDAPPRPSTSLEMIYYQAPHTQMLAMIAFNTPQQLTFPPFEGTLCIAPHEAINLVFLPGWIQSTFPLALPIPNNPNLTGVDVLIQSVAGPSLWTLQGAFSNCKSFQIQ